MRTDQQQKYVCPMHPEVEQDAPGTCPRCGMDLKPRQAPAGDDTPRASGESMSDHQGMIRRMRGPWLWTNFTIIALGAWLITSPFTFGYGNLEQVGAGVARMTEVRELSSLAFRGAAMTWSDVLSGVLLMAFGAFSLRPHPRHDFFGRWGACLVGVWLQFAPLIFWSPSAAAYVNDTLVGSFAIALSILVPMMPGMAHHMAMMKPGPVLPPGWTYNPSSWQQRGPLIALALIGWLISRYLAAVQFGYIPAAWEPFFGSGTLDVLHSDVSRMMPISDAGFGATAYTFEMLMAFMGTPKRWRTMPWMVTFFGILVIPLGIVHIVLVILQPVAVGAWCTLCLAAAATMLLMIPLAVDEVVAMCQFMAQAVREGKPFWWTFFVGDTISGGGPDARTPRYGAPLKQQAPAMVWGVTLPWTLLVSAALGIWLMFAPTVFGLREAVETFDAADVQHMGGALIVTVAAIATAEVIRVSRYVNVLLGLLVAALPWLLSGSTTASCINASIVGLLVMALSLPRGSVRESYGGWDRYVL